MNVNAHGYGKSQFQGAFYDGSGEFVITTMTIFKTFTLDDDLRKLSSGKKLEELVAASFSMRPSRLVIPVVIICDGGWLSLRLLIIKTFAVVPKLDGQVVQNDGAGDEL